MYTISIFHLQEAGQVTYLFQKQENIHPENDVNSEIGMIYFCYPLVTRSDSTVLTQTRLRWSDNLCPHRVIVTTVVTRPKRAWRSPLGLNFSGVQCRPWSNGTIVILTDPWRPILIWYYDFVQWLIL